MKNIHEWRIDNQMQDELGEMFNPVRGSRDLGGSGTTLKITHPILWQGLARRIDHLASEIIAGEMARDPRSADNPSFESEIKQSIIRDIFAIANKVVVDGLQGSHRTVNMGLIGKDVSTR